MTTAFAAILLALNGIAAAQGSAKGDLAMAARQGPGWDAAGFAKLFDAARFGPTDAAVRMPRPQSAPSEVRFTIGPVLGGGRPLVVPSPVATPEYRRTFQSLLARPELTDRYDEMILKYATAYHLDARLLKAVIAAESEFVPRAVSPAGARGLMQVMPATAEEMGVSRAQLYDPQSNIAAGAAYIAWLFNSAWRKYKLKGVRFHDAPLWLKQRIIAAYNAGPRFLFRDGGWYRQTRAYVRKVLLFYHSPVTDVRRGAAAVQNGPRLRVAASSGTLY